MKFPLVYELARHRIALSEHWMSLREYKLSCSMFNVQWNCFNLVNTCNIALILFLKCDVTKFRIPTSPCHTTHTSSTPSSPLNVWRNLWMPPYSTNVARLLSQDVTLLGHSLCLCIVVCKCCCPVKSAPIGCLLQGRNWKGLGMMILGQKSGSFISCSSSRSKPTLNYSFTLLLGVHNQSKLLKLYQS